MHRGQRMQNQRTGACGTVLWTLPQRIVLVREDDGSVTVQFHSDLRRCGDTRPMHEVEMAVASLKKQMGG